VKDRYRGLALLGLWGLLALVPACGQIPASQGWSGTGPGRSTAPSLSGQRGDEICEYVPTGEPAKPVTPPPTSGIRQTGTVTFVLKMTEGNVTITLDRKKSPCTVNSFDSLARQGYFDQTRCHRLADSGIFVLQCGDPTGSGSGGPGYSFANETDGTESYPAGTVAMANAGANTNGSQFFLVYDDSTSLDQTPDYTVFGEFDEASRGVVARMAAEGQDGSNPDGSGRPNNPAEILRVTPREASGR
jgi:peptidyl-prolyl cis-trans isomerase B (cyclophilin B)